MGFPFIFCPGVEGFVTDVALKKIMMQNKGSISNNQRNTKLNKRETSSCFLN